MLIKTSNLTPSVSDLIWNEHLYIPNIHFCLPFLWVIQVSLYIGIHLFPIFELKTNLFGKKNPVDIKFSAHGIHFTGSCFVPKKNGRFFNLNFFIWRNIEILPKIDEIIFIMAVQVWQYLKLLTHFTGIYFVSFYRLVVTTTLCYITQNSVCFESLILYFYIA